MTTPRQKLKKQYSRQNDFIRNKYDRIALVIPAGTKDRIKKHIGPGASVNAWILSLINQELERAAGPVPEHKKTE